MRYQFSESNHYRIIDTFLDSKKDFIILGLCGKTGSGSTTIAQILQTPFDRLNLPQPGDAVGDMQEAAEYRILYTYAQKHWRSFFRIKSSALITAHILKKCPGDFCAFLKELVPSTVYNEKEGAIQTFIDGFFNEKMQFSLSELFQMDPKDSEHLCEWFSRDQILTDEEGKPYSFTPNVRESTLPPVREEDFKEGNLTLEDDSSLPFFYHKESFTVMLTTRDLCSMFWAHKQLRQQKTSFKNPLWICLLRKFIFEYLPAQTAALWKNVASIEHGLEVVALQRLGNNLRISGEPYFVISSRPYSEFVEFQRFSVLSLCNLNKKQALSLVKKIEFDSEIKLRFLKSLDQNLYERHKSFASNPLLLNIMLLTFDNYAEIPEKLHLFYANA